MLVRKTLPAIACLGLLALAGCAKKLDTDRVEVEVKKVLIDRTGMKIASVKCPDDVDTKKGNTFRCTARPVAGEPLAIEVVQEDGEGHVRWRLVRKP
jgi:hypothetical protein